MAEAISAPLLDSRDSVIICATETQIVSLEDYLSRPAQPDYAADQAGDQEDRHHEVKVDTCVNSGHQDAPYYGHSEGKDAANAIEWSNPPGFRITLHCPWLSHPITGEV